MGKILSKIFSNATPELQEKFKVWGNGEGGSSLVVDNSELTVKSLDFTLWDVDGKPYLDPAATNLCLHSRDISNAVWQSAGVAKTPANKTIKSADGSRNVPLFKGFDTMFFQQVTNVPAGEFTLSFLVWANQAQNILCRLPDNLSDGATPTKFQVAVKPYWQRVVLKGTAAGIQTRRIVLADTRKASLPQYNNPATGLLEYMTYPAAEDFEIAFDDVQLEAGADATTYIPTTTASASRVANLPATGQAFYVRPADNRKKIGLTHFANFEGYNNKNVFYISKQHLIADAILVMSQSKTAYLNKNDPKKHITSPRVWQVGRNNGRADGVSKNGLIIPYIDPPHTNEVPSTTQNTPLAAGPDDVSISGHYADRYAKLMGIDKLIVLNCVEGGTGFANNKWTPTGTTYLDMIARIALLKTTYPLVKFHLMIGDIHEADIAAGTPWATHKANWTTLLNNTRGIIGSNVPFVHLGLQDDWTGGTEILKQDYLNGWSELNTNDKSWLPNARFVPTSGDRFPSNTDSVSGLIDNTHHGVLALNNLCDDILSAHRQLLM